MRSARVVVAGRSMMLAVTLFLAGAFSATVVRGGTPGGTTPQAQQSSGALTFTGDLGMLIHYVKGDQTSAYDAAVGKLKESFAKLDSPERKQLGASWTMYKATEPGPNSSSVYVSIFQPPMKDADYNMFKIIAEVFPTEAQEMYKATTASFVGAQRFSFQKIAEFK